MSKKLTAARMRELRACQNPVFDELLDFVQEMSDEYQKWICELEGPTPAELLVKLDEAKIEAAKMKDAWLRTAADFDNYRKQPIKLALSCPRCHQQHVDDGEWATTPHRTHKCVAGMFGPGCGASWAPSEHPTVGVVRSFEIDDMEHTPGSRGQH